MKPDHWDPDRYGRFAAERRQPFADLVALVAPIPGGRAVDLGCGPGELTRELHAKVLAKETLGIDSSEAMLDRARAYAGGGVRFVRGDIGNFTAEVPYDLVFSNAALHWVPSHDALLARLTAAVKPGGQLAFQIPDNYDHPSHRAAAEIASHESFREILGGETHARNVLPPEAYADRLDHLGYAEQTVRLHVYGHRLASREEVVSWVEGSLLSDYRRRLPAPLYDVFLARYRERLMQMLPDERPFFFTFRRILVHARRSA